MKLYYLIPLLIVAATTTCSGEKTAVVKTPVDNKSTIVDQKTATPESVKPSVSPKNAGKIHSGAPDDKKNSFSSSPSLKPEKTTGPKCIPCEKSKVATADNSSVKNKEEKTLLATTKEPVKDGKKKDETTKDTKKTVKSVPPNPDLNIKIIDKPVIWNETRRQMSLDYLKDRFGIIQKEPTIDPKMIVIHHTHSGSFQSAFWTFQPVKIRGKLRYPKAGRLNLSAHFLVDRAGRIYRLLPENIFGRHIIGIGYMAIGIENVGGTKRFPLTYEQLKSNVALVKYLKARFPGIKWLIGHHEYLKFKKTALWKEKDPRYLTYKPDPGWRFMRNLRNRVKHLNLVSEP